MNDLRLSAFAPRRRFSYAVSFDGYKVSKKRSKYLSKKILKKLKNRPEMRILFHTFAGATKEQIEAIVKAWEAMQGK